MERLVKITHNTSVKVGRNDKNIGRIPERGEKSNYNVNVMLKAELNY